MIDQMNNRKNKNENEGITLLIELGNNEKEYLKIYGDSNPDKLAYNFCLEHNLDFNSLQKLTFEIKNALNESKKKENLNNSFELTANKIPINNKLQIKENNSLKNIHSKNDVIEKKNINRNSFKQKYNFKDISKSLQSPIIYKFKIIIKDKDSSKKKLKRKNLAKTETNSYFIGNNRANFKNNEKKEKVKSNYLSPTESSSLKIKNKNNSELKNKRAKTYNNNIKIINIINNNISNSTNHLEKNFNIVNNNKNNEDKKNFGKKLYKKCIKLKEISNENTKNTINKDKKEHSFKPKVNQVNIKSIKFKIKKDDFSNIDSERKKNEEKNQKEVKEVILEEKINQKVKEKYENKSKEKSNEKEKEIDEKLKIKEKFNEEKSDKKETDKIICNDNIEIINKGKNGKKDENSLKISINDSNEIKNINNKNSEEKDFNEEKLKSEEKEIKKENNKKAIKKSYSKNKEITKQKLKVEKDKEKENKEKKGKEENIKNLEKKEKKVKYIDKKNKIIQKKDSLIPIQKEKDISEKRVVSEKPKKSKTKIFKIYEKLYNQRNNIKNIDNKILSKGELFKPKTISNFKGLYNNKSFSQRLIIYKAKSVERKKKLFQQVYPRYDSKTGQKLFQPNINKYYNSSITSQYSNLYLGPRYGKMKKKELQKKIFNIEKKLNEFKANNKSEYLYENQIIKSFKKIFSYLDKNENGKISQFNYITNDLPDNIKKIISPILKKLDLKEKILNEKNFIYECQKLFKSLNYYEKKEIYNFSDFNNKRIYSISCCNLEDIYNNNKYSYYCLTNNSDKNTNDINISQSYYRIKSASYSNYKEKVSRISNYDINEYYINSNNYLSLNRNIYKNYGNSFETRKNKFFDNLVVQRLEEEIIDFKLKDI